MGNISSSSADFATKVYWISKKRDGDYGRPFVEIIKDHCLYGPWIDTKTVYELNLVHCLPNLHWYLLVKKEGASDWPYISLEVTTSGRKDLHVILNLAMTKHLVWALIEEVFLTFVN